MYARLASYAALAAASAWAGWVIQGMRLNERMAALQTEYATAQAQAVEKAHAETIRLQDKLAQAQQRAAARQRDLARDVDGARTALVGLSDAADGALRAASDSHGACIEKADAFADVFGQCRSRLREVGEAADAHADDALTLLESWPVVEHLR